MYNLIVSARGRGREECRMRIGLTFAALLGGIAVTFAACAPKAATPTPGRTAQGRPSTDSAETRADGRSMRELFTGRFPGVQVFEAPDGGISIRIRGAGTIYGSGEPLYVVDGVQLQSGSGGLLFIDPASIAKIEVLKDVGSTAIYGVQGANGVIVIKTKK
jgi:TonB-dependent SusC/RagA subfamily outer membrane receptor